MQKLKKISLFLLASALVFWFTSRHNQCFWLKVLDWNKWWEDTQNRQSTWTIDWEDINTNDPIWMWSRSMGEKSSGILHIPDSTNYNTKLWYALALIQIIVNRALWILAFVALVYMIYNWFLIFSSGSDSKNMDKGKKWIKNAVVAIAWIWISWLIISAMIWFINMISAT